MKTPEALQRRIDYAESRFGPIASTHEALGVLFEEFHELRESVQQNDLVAVRHEALDIAAAAIRLADALLDLDSPIARRSVK